MPRLSAAMRAAKPKADDFGHLVRIISSETEFKMLATLDEILSVQKGILQLLESAFEDGISGRQNPEGDA